jgi:hypothetical protein
MRKQTNTLSPSPKGFQSPKFSDSDFREVADSDSDVWKALVVIATFYRVALKNCPRNSLLYSRVRGSKIKFGKTIFKTETMQWLEFFRATIYSSRTLFVSFTVLHSKEAFGWSVTFLWSLRNFTENLQKHFVLGQKVPQHAMQCNCNCNAILVKLWLPKTFM